MTHRFIWKSGLGLLFVLLSASIAFGQSSSLSGSVTDPQGSAIAGATITVTFMATGANRTTTSTKEGTYTISQLTPGIYRVRAEAQGFASIVQDNVQVAVSSSLTLNLAFTKVGAVSEAVTVQGGESILNTTDATIGNTFNATQIGELPLLSRNVVGLLSLQPGVTTGGNVNGGRSDTANVTLDGVDVNEQQGGSAFFSVLRTTPDSLQEFRVTTTNPNANVGRSSGAQIALVTKSGTNQFHGALFEYHRNTRGTANNWFNNKAGRYVATDTAVINGLAKVGDERVPRPKLIRNNFGGRVGGPIIKDRIFFFFTYEGFREAKGTSVVRQVPLASYGQGIITYVTTDPAGTPCPTASDPNRRCRSLTRAQISAAYVAANGIDPGTNSAVFSVLASAATRYPANDTTTGDGLNTSGFRFNASDPVKQNTMIGRFDGKINDKQNIFLRLNYQFDTSLNGVGRFPDSPTPTTWRHPAGMAVNHAWAISNSLVNNFTYGLTREAFTQGGDSSQNAIVFRFIYQPVNFSRGTSRTTPVHNFVDDVSWSKGSHAMQYGTNVRLISNTRVSFGTSFDNATFNPSGYDASGDVVLTSDSGRPIFANVASSSSIPLRDALTTAIGRYSGYGASINYNLDGSVIAPGTGIGRTFKTQEFEFYGQDSWRLRQNLTLTYGLRWSTSTPVYEANGFQVKPTQSLGDYFDKRVAGALAGVPYNNLVTLDLAGKANGRSGFYPQDWNNFAPSVAVAWTPNFKNKFLKSLLGENKSTLRTGFRIIYDRIGSALAVGFDGANQLGFTSQSSIAVNTYNVSTRLGPLFTGLNQDIRTLPGLIINSSLKFPLSKPADGAQRIESSLDDRLTTPIHYSFNMSYARDFGRGYSMEVSYVGRLARNLLSSRDIMHFNNLVDPRSGMDFYTAMRQLIALRYQNAAINSVQPIPYFQNLFPGLAGTFTVNGQSVALTATQNAYRRIAQRCADGLVNPDGTCVRATIGGQNETDYTFVQVRWNNTPISLTNNTFIQPQYATYAAYGTQATSDFHSAQLSFRKRFTKDLSFDFNYTFSHSLDLASAGESSASLTGVSILNPLDLDINRGNSAFDVRHLVNANYIWALPLGTGKKFFGGVNRFVDGIIGGWELTGIFRYNSGFPAPVPFDDSRWATNWNVQSNALLLRPLETSPTRTGDPNLFGDPTAAYRSYRNAYPGEVGDKNTLRYPGFIGLDAGLYKTFKLHGENQKVTFRWEVFNVTNTQAFTGISSISIPQDPSLGGSASDLGKTPPASWGKFTGIQGSPRQMQFALRFEF